MVVQINNKNKSTQGLGRITSTNVYQSLGCTDNNASNYNSNATVDDGSCCYVDGCTDPVATNYDPTACFDDGSCNYDVAGCMDANYHEYNSNANVDDPAMCLNLITYGCLDGSQVTSAYGVTYNVYYNYQPWKDQACTQCDGLTAVNCCCLAHIPGCTNEGASNYDATATINDGSCDNAVVYGCMDATALNYSAYATWDNGSCCYIAGCTNPNNTTNFDASACIDDGSCITAIYGCVDPTASNYDPNANMSDGSCTYIDGCTDDGAYNYNPSATTDDGSCCYNAGCDDASADNYDANACHPDGSCLWAGCQNPLYVEYNAQFNTGDDATYCLTLITPGCMDATACNYNATATYDDGSCTFAGCTNIAACNYNPAAGCDDASCIFPDGCTDPTAANYDPNADCDDGSCNYGVLGCMTPCWSNYDPNATIDDGSCASGTYTPDAYGVGGCIDPNACNYDPTAVCDNGTCTLPDGCTDPTATNFDPNATCDDGTCIACVYGCMDPNQSSYDPNATCMDESMCNFGLGSPGYGGDIWVGTNGDITDWFFDGTNGVNGNNTVANDLVEGWISITKGANGTNANGVSLKTDDPPANRLHTNYPLFRGSTANWDGTKSYYMMKFDARTAAADQEVKMRIYADAPISMNITTSETIQYYGDNNTYKTFYMFFEALPANGVLGPNNYSFQTTAFQTGETVYIRNIDVKQHKIDINNIFSVNVNSIMHPTYTSVDGRYFFFENSAMDTLLGYDFVNATTSVEAIQVRNGMPIRFGQMKLWDETSANSDPADTNDTISNSHGRWGPPNESAAGDWQIGDKIILILP